MYAIKLPVDSACEHNWKYYTCMSVLVEHADMIVFTTK